MILEMLYTSELLKNMTAERLEWPIRDFQAICQLSLKSSSSTIDLLISVILRLLRKRFRKKSILEYHFRMYPVKWAHDLVQFVVDVEEVSAYNRKYFCPVSYDTIFLKKYEGFIFYTKHEAFMFYKEIVSSHTREKYFCACSCQEAVA